jgi:two-component system, NarL family, nitrate/nitrite response regulator NarL
MNSAIRLVVVDDHPLYRDGVVRTLKEHDGLEVVGQGGSADDAVLLCMAHKPDVALLDVSMRGGGIAAAGRVMDVINALEQGVKGYVLKGVEGSELVSIIHRVASGESYVAPSLAAGLLVSMKLTMKRNGEGTRASMLTEREEGILRLVSLGCSNKEIGRHLDLQEKTVKHYMTGILQKLNVRNRVEAAVVAREQLGMRPGDSA